MASTSPERGTRLGGFIERAKALLTRPKEAWPEIDRDMTPSGELFTRYAAPLAAIGPACGLIAGNAFGWSPFGGNLIGQLFTAAGSYAFSMVNLLVMSFVAAKLAPRYGGTGSPRDAFKLITWSSTAAWLAGAAVLVPPLSFLGLAALYSLYLFFTGIGPMMKVPEANKRRYGFVVILCALVLGTVTSLISSTPSWLFGGGRHGPVIDEQHDMRFDISEESAVDGRAIRDIAREVRESIRKGEVKAIPPSDLQLLLPESIGNFRRTGLESATSGPGGSHAEATYEDGNREFTLKIVDLSGFGAVARIGTAFKIEKNREDEDGFEHVSTKDGHLIVEKWDKNDEEGSYVTMVGKRFLIEAEGEADSFDRLKQAVGGIDESKLTALASQQ